MERRLTKFPGSANRNIFNKRPNNVDTQEPQPIRDVPNIPDHAYINPRPRPPALPLKANPNSQHYQPAPPLKRPRNPACHSKSPWESHYAIFIVTHMDGDSRVTVAHRNEPHHTIVAIKKHQLKAGQLVERLIPCSHTNIVNLLEAFHDDGFVHMAYEWTDVTLAEIQSTPLGKLSDFHIAAICKEVKLFGMRSLGQELITYVQILQGLQYIHEALHIMHGALDVHNVMVDRAGQIKICKNIVVGISSIG